MVQMLPHETLVRERRSNHLGLGREGVNAMWEEKANSM